MSRLPTIAQLTRRLNEHKAREAKLKARQAVAPKVGTGQPRPMESVKYNSIFMANAFVLHAPERGIAYFGGLAALGLAAPDDSPRKPVGFKPARIMAMRGRATPVERTSDLSGRSYLKYSQDGTGSDQQNFSAPISADTPAALKTRVSGIMQAKKDDSGEYGRIWFEPERPIFSVSGDTGT